MAFSEQMQTLIDRRQKVLTILWAALTFSVVPYVVVPIALSYQPGVFSPPELPAIFRPVMIGIAGIAGALSFLLRFLLLSDRRLMNIWASDLEAKRHPRGEGDRASLEILATLPEKELRLFSLFHPFFQATILRCGLADAIGIIGLLLSLLEKSVYTILPFVLISLALNASFYPRFKDFLEIIEFRLSR